jgi:hypothetical protein
MYSKIDRMNKVQLKRFHARIVGILDPEKQNQLFKSGTKTGVVIDAEEYIKQRVNQIMIENAINQFQPTRLRTMNGTEDSSVKPNDISDIGNYEVKRAPSGKLAAQREPVYKYIPTSAEPEVPAYRRRRSKVILPASKKRTLETTATREFNDDPFSERTTTKRINILF